MSDFGDIYKKLENLQVKIAAASEKGLRRGLLRVSRTAKLLAPVDGGRLRNSITTEISRDSDDSVSGTVGTNVVYAPFVELGTSRMSAIPFLEPALKISKDAAMEDISNAVKAAFNDGYSAG